MPTSKVLEFLRCPEDHSELTPANDELVRQINSDIQAGRIRNRGGRTLNEPLDGGLVRARGDLLYPIIRKIPVLIRDEAIAIDTN
jgi:uncharacterized protein YbaR (Trm112 family)